MQVKNVTEHCIFINLKTSIIPSSMKHGGGHCFGYVIVVDRKNISYLYDKLLVTLLFLPNDEISRSIFIQGSTSSETLSIFPTQEHNCDNILTLISRLIATVKVQDKFNWQITISIYIYIYIYILQRYLIILEIGYFGFNSMLRFLKVYSFPTYKSKSSA